MPLRMVSGPLNLARTWSDQGQSDGRGAERDWARVQSVPQAAAAHDASLCSHDFYCSPKSIDRWHNWGEHLLRQLDGQLARFRLHLCHFP
mmetsp:Transcript_70469/g.139680  ORF Transcript_70469/g.139680 Transcript_70469/m.139680 type:complete len:90 (+) Transcript_70469:263-532(+)